jgi:putative transposase
VLLRREGWPVNHKRIYRLYHEEGLSIRTKYRKKRVSLPRIPLPPASHPNERWSIDFLTDSLVDGRRFRIMTIVDNVSRVSPAIEVDVSITGERVVATLNQLKEATGLPNRIAVDNGPEFISKALDVWAYRNQVTLEFSRLGKPTDNAYVESFNGHFRAECLDQHWFESLAEAKEVIEAWRVEYNEERPHRSLQQRAPAAVLASWQPPEKAAD